MDADKKLENLNAIRHSLAHILAMAVLEKFPSAKLGIGPVIENGFYYDFKLPKPISDEILPEIEKTMRQLIKDGLDFNGEKITPAKAKNLFAKQPFKLELIKDFIKEKLQLTAYTTSGKKMASKFSVQNSNRQNLNFVDLCRGGHIKNTLEINPDAFKLTHTAGAYWKGSEKNPQLTRIYGIAFETKSELDDHLKKQEEAKKRDHRKLGKELGLFTIIDDIGPGLPLFYPKGAILRRTIENFISELQEKNGYKPIWIPHITKSNLYQTSGHLEKFDALYPPMKLKDEADYYLKPMNCPHFMMLYRETAHSYREMPIRWVSTTTNYRYEKSGELSGLTRVRALTQDDCHVFARQDKEQIASEIELMLDMIAQIYAAFNFNDFWVRISTRDANSIKKYLGDTAIWDYSEKILTDLIAKRGWKYEIGIGEAAFYGPKLDFIFKDVLSREWQLSTIQLDMNLPERFALEYTDPDGSKKRPVVIHRAILGSVERFLGIIIEHFGGAFPFWLAPVQIMILAVNDSVTPYCQELMKNLSAANIRAEIDSRNESVGKKIRETELQKIPFMLIVGDKEKTANTVSARERGGKDLGTMQFAEFKNLLPKN